MLKLLGIITEIVLEFSIIAETPHEKRVMSVFGLNFVYIRYKIHLCKN